MKIPKELKILGHRYKVKKHRQLFEGSGASGSCCTNLLKIKVGSNFPTSRRDESLLHEIIEALKFHLEIKLEHPDLSALSEGLYQVINSNKLKF